MSGPDFRIDNHGSIVVLQPLTKAGIAWSVDHLPRGFGWGFHGVVVEPRFLDDIVNGIAADGLVVS